MIQDESGPACSFEVGAEGGARVVAIEGSLADEANIQAKDLFLRLIGEKPGRILIDLSGMDYISSSGIGLLVSTLRRCRESAIPMILCGLRPGIQELFKLTRLNQVFEIRESRAAALERR